MRSIAAIVTLGVLCINSLVAARLVCTNTTRVTGAQADYLFLVDASSSMCDKIAAVASGLSDFSVLVNKSKIQARYGIVQFGGTPKIMLPFVKDVNSARTVLSAMGCTAGGQEAAFEALRGSVSPKNGVDFIKSCPNGTLSADCLLKWNTTSSKIIIMVTDEDSDLPTMVSYRMPGQNSSTSFCAGNGYRANGTCYDSGQDPSFMPAKLVNVSSTRYNMFRSGPNMRLGDQFETELDLTASMLTSLGIFLNSVVSTEVSTSRSTIYAPISAFNSYDSSYFRDNNIDLSLADNVTTATYQFGHPNFQVQASNFSSFNSTATYSKLVANGFGNSLQARMLSAGLYSRVFDIANFDGSANQAGVVQAFYNSIVDTTAYLEQFCEVVSDAVTSSSLVVGASSTAIKSTTTLNVASSTVASSSSSSSSLALSATSSSLVAGSSSTALKSTTTLNLVSSTVASSSSSVALSTTSSSLVAGSSSSAPIAVSSTVASSSSSSSSLALSMTGSSSTALKSTTTLNLVSSTVTSSSSSVALPMASTSVVAGPSSTALNVASSTVASSSSSSSVALSMASSSVVAGPSSTALNAASSTVASSSRSVALSMASSSLVAGSSSTALKSTTTLNLASSTVASSSRSLALSTTSSSLVAGSSSTALIAASSTVASSSSSSSSLALSMASASVVAGPSSTALDAASSTVARSSSSSLASATTSLAGSSSSPVQISSSVLVGTSSSSLALPSSISQTMIVSSPAILATVGNSDVAQSTATDSFSSSADSTSSISSQTVIVSIPTILATMSMSDGAQSTATDSLSTDSAFIFPTQFQVSANTENLSGNGPNIGSILGAVIGGVVALTVAAALVIHRRRATSIRRQRVTGLDSLVALVALNSNPLYVDQFGFRENPMYRSEGVTESLMSIKH